MLGVRIGLLVLYLGGMAALSRYLRGRMPGSTGDPTSGKIIWWIWGPSLWPFPGLLWLGILNLSPGMIFLLSFLLPLSCLALFLWRRRMMSVTTAGFIALVTLFALAVAATTPGLLYGRMGLFVISLVGPVLFSCWLLTIWVPRVVPLPEDVDRRTSWAMDLVLGFLSGGPKSVWVVEDGHVCTRIAGNPWSGAGPGLLMTEPENVVVLKAGSEIARVAGPGVVLLQRSETPYRVVDLRDQFRSASITMLTRDGIETRASISATFRVNRGNRDVLLGEAWPFRNQGDVLQALLAEEVDPVEHSLVDAHMAHPWEDLPMKIAAHKLEQAIPYYSLDQLNGGAESVVETECAVGVNSHIELLKTHRRLESALGLGVATDMGDSLTRLTISRLVLRATRLALEPRGFNIDDVSISSSIEPLSYSVTEQRVEAWKSRFVAKVVDWQAELERKRALAQSKIRQEVREKLLSEMIEEASRRSIATDSDAQRDFIAYTMLSSLIRMAAHPEVQHMLPESALSTLARLYEQVNALAELEDEP